MSKSTKIDRHQDYCTCGAIKQKTAKTCMACYNKKRAAQKKEKIIKNYNLQKNEKIDYSDEYLNELKKRDPNRICYIYKITNLINGKLYIGLTTNTIQQRWYYHLKDLEKKKSALYNAMNKYGVKNFKIETIEQCTLSNVREREKYWISFYNTYLDDTKGYNQSAGGELCILKTEDEKDIIELYNKYQNVTLVANELHADRARIVRVLSKNDIEIKTAQEHQKEKAYSIFQYDENNNLVQEFQSKYEAGQWAIDNNFSTAKNARNAGDTIRHKIMLGETDFYGYIWKLDENYPQESIDKFIKNYNTKHHTYQNKETICYIYKIINLINNKVFISFTTLSIEFAWWYHMTHKQNKQLNIDINNNFNNFTIEIIEKCNLDEVESKEAYWIKNYNTFLDNKKGYNIEINHKLDDIIVSEENGLIKYYKKYKSIENVVSNINIDADRLKKILFKNNIVIKKSVKPKTITPMNSKKIREKKNKREETLKYKKRICPICGNKKTTDSNLCKTCYSNIETKKRKAKYIEKINKTITREELKLLIRTTSFSEIGQTYNVNGNTIKKWCKLYNLPFRKLDIDKISDEDWESENWNLENIEKYQITHHKKIIPEYNQLKKDLYNMEKTELIEKYDYSCIKYFNKMVKKFRLLTDREIIQKFTFEEWNEEKWKDKDFYNYAIKNRYSVKYPERDWFKREIRTRSFKDISSDFNVDKSTIKKILIYFNLPYYRDEILLYTDEEWENEIWSYDTPATTEKGGKADE